MTSDQQIEFDKALVHLPCIPAEQHEEAKKRIEAAAQAGWTELYFPHPWVWNYETEVWDILDPGVSDLSGRNPATNLQGYWIPQ